jgi:hypothetical protein
VIVPLLLPGLLAGAAVWGLAALLLPGAAGPAFGRATAPASDRATAPARTLLAALVWSAATVIATVAALRAAGAGALSPSASTLVLGALASTAVLSLSQVADAPLLRRRWAGGDARLA